MRAGWIPPEFREFVYAPLTEVDIQNIQNTASVFENGKRRPFTREEAIAQIQKVIGVIDTRTGEYHPNQSTTPFMQVEI